MQRPGMACRVLIELHFYHSLKDFFDYSSIYCIAPIPGGLSMISRFWTE